MDGEVLMPSKGYRRRGVPFAVLEERRRAKQRSSWEAMKATVAAKYGTENADVSR